MSTTPSTDFCRSTGKPLSNSRRTIYELNGRNHSIRPAEGAITGIRYMKKALFKNPYGHLRAGWRVLIYLLAVVIASLPFIGLLLLISWIFDVPGGGDDVTSLTNLIFFLFIDLSLILAAWIMLRWIDHRPFALLGLGFHRSSLSEFLTGFAIGFLNLVAVFLALWISGYVVVTMNRPGWLVLATLGQYLLAYGLAAALEELLNRGYIFQALCEGTRAWIAVLTLSFLFVLGHLANENLKWSGALHLFLHGILYAALYLKTRSLWVPIGLHLAWNWTQGPVFGFHVSGMEVSNTLLQTVPVGPELLSGGAFGAEGSIISSLVSIALILWIWRSKRLKPAPELDAMWRRYPGGFRLDPREQSGSFTRPPEPSPD